MKCKWRMVTVQDLIDAQMIEEPKDGNHGNIHPKSTDYVTQGIPFIMANDLVNGRVDYQHCAYISEKQAQTLKKGFSHPGDILLTHKATIGRTAIVTDDYETIILTPQVTYYRTIKGILNRYLKYYFDCPYFQNILANWAGAGSTRAYLGITAQKKLPILLPALEAQNKIAKILSALDDKIELNNRINKNLEAQAQAIYKHMFVNNNGYKFKKGVLGEIAEIIMGQSPSGSTYNERGIGSVFFQGRAEFGERFPSIRLYTTEPNRMACANDVLMSVRAPVGDLNIAHDNCCIGRGLAAIRSKTNHQSFVLYTLLSLKRELEAFNGEGTVFGSINRDSLKNIPVIIPEIQKIDEFEKLVSPIDAIIRNNYDEICTLKQTRDTLLPKLMSGELDVENLNV